MRGPGSTRYPASYPSRPLKETVCTARFPAAFRPPALASWAILFPPQEFGLPHGRLTETLPGPGRGFHVPHAQDSAGEGAAYIPGAAVFMRPIRCLGSPPAAFQRPAPAPRHRNHLSGAHFDETSSAVHSRSLVRPSPHPRSSDGSRAASAFPRASHPAVTSDARQGWGQGNEHIPGLRHRQHRRPPLNAPLTHATSCRTTCEVPSRQDG